MADYTIVGQRPDTEVIGGAKVQDVQVISVQTKEHNVYFELRLPRNQATTATIKNQAGGYTIIYELLFTIPGVSDVQWTQEPTPSGELGDHVLVYVVSDTGLSEGVLDFPFAHFNQDYIAPKVASLVKALNATEAP